MCSERYIKVKLVLLMTGGFCVWPSVCVCMCVCVGANVWQTRAYIEGPRDVPWAPANPSEGSPLHNRPAQDLVRIRPSPAWCKGKAALATVGFSDPAVSQLGFIQPGVPARGGRESLRGQDGPMLAS